MANRLNWNRKLANPLTKEQKEEQVTLWQQAVMAAAVAGDMNKMQEHAKELTRWQQSLERVVVSDLELRWRWASKCAGFLYQNNVQESRVLGELTRLLGLFENGEITTFEEARAAVKKSSPSLAGAWEQWDAGLREAGLKRKAGRSNSKN